MNEWSWGWIIWLTLTVGGFLALEIPAIIRKNNSTTDPDTLSDHLALWFRVNTWKGRWIWTGVISAAGAIVVWVGLHIITGQAV